jgi:hypothetical protein
MLAMELPVDLMFRASTVRKLALAIRDLLVEELDRVTDSRPRRRRRAAAVA